MPRMTAPRSAYLACNALNRGTSSIQTCQVLAQNTMTTTLPRRLSRLIARPARDLPEKLGAFNPTLRLAISYRMPSASRADTDSGAEWRADSNDFTAAALSPCRRWARPRARSAADLIAALLLPAATSESLATAYAKSFRALPS